MHWMFMPFRRYADFSGRSRRMEYWMFILFNFIVTSILSGIAFSSADPSLLNYDPVSFFTEVFSSFGGILLTLYSLIILVPIIALNVRRLHDRDMVGWWYLGMIICSAIPILNFVTSIGYLVLMILPGTQGPNRFGPDPLDPGSADTFA